MRQGQQNRRGRGRNRKAHHNPLTRSYESNGPDVKIRGTPSHIAEKYMSLARDALSSGDPVLAENYLQHAEHYNRIIMTVREQTAQQSGEMMNGVGRHGIDSMEGDDFSDDDVEEMDGFTPHVREHQHQQQSQHQHQSRGGGQPRYDDRPHRQHDQGRPGRDRYQEPRGSYAERQQPQPAPAPQPVQQMAEQPAFELAAPQPRAERAERPERTERTERTERPERAERAERPERAERAERAESPRRRERFSSSVQEQPPEFLRRPVRRPRRDTNGSGSAEANGAAVKDETGDQ